MMSEVAPYYVVVDANIWVAERLLQSSIGNAFLYAVTGAKSLILLPEVVELEIARVLPDMAERAVVLIKRELSLLRQLSGHNLTLAARSALAIAEGINERWKQLGGVLMRVPFTHDQARSALHRVIRKSPPSGDNNEQFRDCCIWDAAMLMATERVIHLVSADGAFFEGRNKAAGLATILRTELAAAKKNIQVHSRLRDFLAATDAGATIIDEAAIGSAIVKSVTVEAKEIAVKGEGMRSGANFELGKAHSPRISGYATPKPSLIAISFEAAFDLERIVVEEETEMREDATLILKGVCSYNPTSKEVSEIEIREWSKSLKFAGGGFWGTKSPDKSAMERQYGPGRMRIIS
jgi:hypothetical protein